MNANQDPRITTLTLLFTSISISFANQAWELHALTGLSLLYLILLKRYSLAGIYLGTYFLLWGLIFTLPPRVGSALIMLYVTAQMLPMFAVGSILFSTPPNMILSTGQKIHLPQKLLIMICLLFRISSVLPIEMKTINEGIRARNILPYWYSPLLHPLHSYECLVLPLIIRALKLSTELSCAAEFRGLESNQSRSCIYATSIFKPSTVLAFLYMLTGCAILIYGSI